MQVRVIDLGAEEPGVIEAVDLDRRAVVVAGERYVLHPLTARWVREGDPYYGRRLALTPEAAGRPPSR
ncbi:MAG TPA: hypothetical protein VFZ89_13070 [Solirubrobacteraceae bacterium]